VTDVLTLILLLVGPPVSIAKVDATSLSSAAVRGPAVVAQSGQGATRSWQIEPKGPIDTKKLLLQVADPLLRDRSFEEEESDDEDGGSLHLLRPLSTKSIVFGERYTESADLTLKLRKDIGTSFLKLSSRLALRLKKGNWGDLSDLRDANRAELELFASHIKRQIDKGLESACGTQLAGRAWISC
jgi:hypothetical protein